MLFLQRYVHLLLKLALEVNLYQMFCSKGKGILKLVQDKEWVKINKKAAI